MNIQALTPEWFIESLYSGASSLGLPRFHLYLAIAPPVSEFIGTTYYILNNFSTDILHAAVFAPSLIQISTKVPATPGSDSLTKMSLQTTIKQVKL